MTELALPYVPIDPNIADSERMDLFITTAGIEDDHAAPWYVVSLLLWAGRKRPDGDLGALTDWALARACNWPGEPAELKRALVESGWLVDNGDGGHLIEGWDRHGGRVLEKRRKWRKQKRGQRDVRADTVRTSGGHPQDVRTESAACPGGVRALKGEGEGEGEYLEKGSFITTDQLISAVLNDLPKLGRPGYAQENRIAKLLPMARVDVAAQVKAMQANAAKPNWGYLIQCLETPIERKPRLTHPGALPASQYQTDMPPPPLVTDAVPMPEGFKQELFRKIGEADRKKNG